MIAVPSSAWAAAAAVLAMGGCFAWTWMVLETIEVSDPRCQSRDARRSRLVVTLIAMVASLAGATHAWDMAKRPPASAVDRRSVATIAGFAPDEAGDEAVTEV